MVYGSAIVIDKMIESQIWWVPTLALVPLSIEHRKKNKEWANNQLAQEDVKDAQIYSLMQTQIPLWKEAVRRGIKVAMGTDQSHRLLVGENMAELHFMVEWLGMSPMDVIVSATTRAAPEWSTAEYWPLKSGCLGDVLVIDGDPLADIRVLEQRDRLHLIMKDGHAFTNHLNS